MQMLFLHVFYSVYNQRMTYYTSIIVIPRGGLALASFSTTPWWQLVNMGPADYQSLLKNQRYICKEQGWVWQFRV